MPPSPQFPERHPSRWESLFYQETSIMSIFASWPLGSTTRVIKMTTGDAINMTQERHIQQVKLSYTETKSRTFSATLRTTGKMLFTIWMMVFTMASTASTSSSTPKKKSCDVKC
ncbi:hypothetical protein AAG906_018737 [Vitis piasezkii]